MAKDSEASSPTEVVVRPSAFCSMVLHADRHTTEVVHGLLLGSSVRSTITVDEAVPLCHASPTLPLIETAIGLVEMQTDSSIVGWYTAPMIYEDRKPGPIAMRMTSNLETEKKPCTLLVLNNSALGDCIKGNSSEAQDAVQAYGKDFGKQFQEAIRTTVQEGDGACQALVQAKTNGIRCNDLEDNMDDPSSTWYPSKPLTKLIDSICQDTI